VGPSLVGFVALDEGESEKEMGMSGLNDDWTCRVDRVGYRTREGWGSDGTNAMACSLGGRSDSWG